MIQWFHLGDNVLSAAQIHVRGQKKSLVVGLGARGASNFHEQALARGLPDECECDYVQANGCSKASNPDYGFGEMVAQILTDGKVDDERTGFEWIG